MKQRRPPPGGRDLSPEEILEEEERRRYNYAVLPMPLHRFYCATIPPDQLRALPGMDLPAVDLIREVQARQREDAPYEKEEGG